MRMTRSRLAAATGTCCVLPNTHVGTGDITATQIIDSPRC
jgi:hypothetical protein